VRGKLSSGVLVWLLTLWAGVCYVSWKRKTSFHRCSQPPPYHTTLNHVPPSTCLLPTFVLLPRDFFGRRKEIARKRAPYFSLSFFLLGDAGWMELELLEGGCDKTGFFDGSGL